MPGTVPMGGYIYYIIQFSQHFVGTGLLTIVFVELYTDLPEPQEMGRQGPKPFLMASLDGGGGHPLSYKRISLSLTMP